MARRRSHRNPMHVVGHSLARTSSGVSRRPLYVYLVVTLHLSDSRLPQFEVSGSRVCFNQENSTLSTSLSICATIASNVFSIVTTGEYLQRGIWKYNSILFYGRFYSSYLMGHSISIVACRTRPTGMFHSKSPIQIQKTYLNPHLAFIAR